MDRVFSLVDCEKFYFSCERIFDPSLCGRPVAVLSNNDGCIIARSEELEEMGAAVLSSNYALYGDMSSRAASILESEASELKRYSIDEAFLTLPALSRENLCRGETRSADESKSGSVCRCAPASARRRP